MARQHRPKKGHVKMYGATFELVEKGKFVKGELKPKPSPTKEYKNGR
ncbi:MAG: hypothetical protein JWO19_6121 [Bryobacterales bacterium]|nr:hypothetical protein [Bryobacterales bacterium]